MIQVKRTYDPPARRDGQRILVERLWPRGIAKQDLPLTAWMKEIAPSAELRTWFAHRVERWDEFRRRYRRELDANDAAVQLLLEMARRGNLTLLYSARDTLHNSARVLHDYLEQRMATRGGQPRPRRRLPSKPRGVINDS